jgi:hypothetical protein
MFKKPTKRQFIIRRIALSALATFAVLVIVTTAILFMLGFRLDGMNGRLEQGALLQFDSTPSGADVSIDGRNIGSRTATKQTVIAGTHTIKMTKSGYQDWTRTLTLSAGTLTWLDYTRLVPKDRPVQTITTYEALAGAKFSPDSKWALLQALPNKAEFELADLRSEDVKTSTLILPQASYTDATTEGVTHSFNISSWDSGGRYVLVKHLFRDQTEWLVVDTQNGSQTVNVTQLLSVGLTDVQFASTNGKVLYGLTNDGTIRKIDLSEATLSRAFISHVQSFSVFDNTVLSYVGVDSADAAKRVAGVYRDGDESAHVLRSVSDPDTILKIATGRYFSDEYVAIAEGDVVTVLKGSYPSSSSQDNSSLKTLTHFELPGSVSAVSFSPKGDYVLAQSGESYKSYEIEHQRTASGMIAVSAGSPASTLKWLDVAHVWNDDAGMLMMRDFDGSNMFAIMNVATGYDASLSQNGRFFYAIGRDDKGFHLQRVKMILEQ